MIKHFIFFKIPKLDDPPVIPPVGPRAGGTQVYIKGRNIGIGSTRSVTMAGQPCIILNEAEIRSDSIGSIVMYFIIHLL